jgi:transcriptional regulator with XRE-family HTH domain
MPDRTFAERLRRIIDADPDLTVAGLAVRAGLDNSALRSLLSGKSKNPRLDTAMKVCAALGTTLEDFLSGAFEAGRSPTLTPGRGLLAGGFAEDGATFVAKPRARDLDAFPDLVEPQVYRVARHHIAFALLEGDRLVVDMRSTAAPGSLAIVTRADLDTGEAWTLIRRIEDHGILSDDPTEPLEVWNGPGHNYAALGRIAGVVRRL